MRSGQEIPRILGQWDSRAVFLGKENIQEAKEGGGKDEDFVLNINAVCT
jgi:hypothetical protein